MKKIIVTAGAKGADIDVLACVVAYSELLKSEGHNAVPVVPGNFTSSVTPSILKWEFLYEREYIPDGDEAFVLVDISDPNHVPDFVNVEAVREVYDHRYGHENFWQERLTDGFHIEMVGSCGTLIWEQFKKRGKDNKISEVSARLLLASIVSNTLNFKSTLTTNRDRNAYQELEKIADLPSNWIETYFKEQESELTNDFAQYLQTDTKVLTIQGNDFVIAQIEMWDASDILKTRQADIDAVMKRYADLPWLVNIISIAKGHNYIYSNSSVEMDFVAKKLRLKFENNIAKTDRLMMRKEITKLLTA